MKVILCSIFNLALDDETLSVNPALNLGKLISKKKALKPKEVDVITSEELSLLLHTFETHFPEYYPIALTLAKTGMRIGEVFALQWGDIDFNSYFITVKRSYSSGRFITSPKSGRFRHVDMTMQLTEVLRKYKRSKPAVFGENIPDWVFSDTTGKILKPGSFRDYVFYKALKMAELRKIKPHVLRHTVASILLNRGCSMLYVKEQLGHSSIKTTLDLYGHFMKSENQGVINILDEVLENALNRTLSALKKEKRTNKENKTVR